MGSLAWLGALSPASDRARLRAHDGVILSPVWIVCNGGTATHLDCIPGVACCPDVLRVFDLPTNPRQAAHVQVDYYEGIRIGLGVLITLDGSLALFE